jgi:superfamily II DNA or RNA helicase
MKTPYKHQQKFIERNRDRDLLVWEGGTGKTFAGSLWLNQRKHLKALVVCPKAIIGKWKKDLKDDGAKADVCSRDDIKKIDLNKYQCLILDEAQDHASPIFEKGRSQRTTVLYNYIKNNQKAHILLLSASPVRSTPWNIHTLAVYLGVYWDVKKFRDEFFHLTNKFGRFHYEKNKDWRVKIRPYIESVSDIVLMSDLVDVPKQHHQVIHIPFSKEQEKELLDRYLEPSAEWHERHRAENGKKKFEELQKILDQYRKVIVVCYYTKQIADYVGYIGEDRQVFVLNGQTKDQDEVIRQAQEADDCIFFVQASMGAGFDADQFSVVVFASMSFKYVDYAQMKFRVKRIHNLHENTFIHLIGGKCDKAVYNTIDAGKNFDVVEYLAGTSRGEKEEGTKSNPESFGVVQEELDF